MPRMRLGVAMATCVALLAGCGTVSTMQRPDTYYAAQAKQRAMAAGETAQSLFAPDGAVLSDAEISRILTFRHTIRPKNRIAIVALNRAYWFRWSDELAQAGAALQNGLVAKLRASPIVYDASFLPSLLLPPKHTVGHFREAGARYQADFILIYRASCRTYEKYRFFARDKAKSFCNVEAVLLDVATGIVPFTVTASRDFTTEKRPADFNLVETRRRVELEAIGAALAEAGDALVLFIGGLPRS